jgi:hypothetical protein
MSSIHTTALAATAALPASSFHLALAEDAAPPDQDRRSNRLIGAVFDLRGRELGGRPRRANASWLAHAFAWAGELCG